MIPLSTKILALTLVLTSACIFIYYVILVLVLPLVQPNHDLHDYFPDPYYGVALPLLGVVLTLSATCVLAGVVILQASHVNYQKLQTMSSSLVKAKR